MSYHLWSGGSTDRVRRADVLAGLWVAAGLGLAQLLAEGVARRLGAEPADVAGSPVDDLLLALLAGAACVPLLARRRASRERDERLERVSDELFRRRAAEADERRRYDAVRDRIANLIQTDGLAVHLQPIFGIGEPGAVGAPAGYEALARFPDGRGPEVWFADARCVGLGVALDTYAFVRAIEVLPSLPEEAYLSINLSPDTLLAAAFWSAMPEGCGDRVIVELTEHVHIQDYDEIRLLLNRLRRLGLRIAIDDAGAGFSSLRHIIQLGPDVIKLDRDLIRHCDVDPVRRTLAEALVGFAQRIGAGLVAEGVETAGELATLRSIGVDEAQGYLLARPAALCDLARPVAAEAS